MQFDLKDILSSLVSCNSTLNNEKSVNEWIDWYLKKNNFKTKRIKVGNRFNIYAYRGNEASSDVIWYGHVDTVPVYSGWKTDPFTLVESKDRYYGLGSCDMKGGIAALFYAITRLDENIPIRLLLCVDEEYDSNGAWTVYNNYQKVISNANYLISMEPGASATKVGGSDTLTLGRRGRIRLVVDVKGVSAHGGHPERGVNAIDLACELSDLFKKMKLTRHDKLGISTHYVANIKGNSEGLSLPEQCQFELDRHLVVPDTVESVLAEYNKIISDYLVILNKKYSELSKNIKITINIKKRKNPYMLPFVTDLSDSYVKQVVNEIKKTQKSVIINYGRSVGDENIFANMNIKPIILGPEGGNIHSANEWVSIKSLNECVENYTRLIRL